MTRSDLSRRNFLAASSVLGAGAVAASCSAAEAGVTPAQTEGPFYPIADQADKDADLTRIKGRDEAAKGEVVQVEGRVLDEQGAPIAEAVVDIWQANAAGRYAHERDPNPAPLDPNFQGWAILSTDAEGRYGFKTIRPGAYPVAEDWSRPPHIHFKVSRRGYREVTTQMYFAGEALNEVDRLLNDVPEDSRAALVAQVDAATGAYTFDIVLAEV